MYPPELRASQVIRRSCLFSKGSAMRGEQKKRRVLFSRVFYRFCFTVALTDGALWVNGLSSVVREEDERRFIGAYPVKIAKTLFSPANGSPKKE